MLTKQAFMNHMASVLRQDQYDEMERRIKTVDDYEFNQMIAQMMHELQTNPSILDRDSSESMRALQDKIWQTNDINMENVATNTISVKTLPRKMVNVLLQKAEASSPQETVRLTHAEDLKLAENWKSSAKYIHHKNGDRFSIPCDIVVEQTIPLKDCNIEIDETSIGNSVIKYRVVIFEKHLQKRDGRSVIVGALIVTGLIFPIWILDGQDVLPFGGAVGIIDSKIPSHIFQNSKASVAMIGNMYIQLMETWFSIQYQRITDSTT